MNETASESPAVTWTDPQCPFPIDYSPQVFDDIRLAVVDAFFSLPRGGAEIGGILLGRYDNGRLAILDYTPIDCEHATGPSFTLSARDEENLGTLLSNVRSEHPDLRPVGWYHSHTRSEIFLSDADLAIHHRYFSDPWQVALVLKPHTFQPTRAGFFFRENDDSIHATGAYEEFILTPLPMRPVPVTGAPEDLPKAEGRPTTVKLERNPSIGVAAQPASGPPGIPAAAPAPLEQQPALVLPPPPAFLTEPPPATSRRWIATLWVAGIAALAAGGYQTQGVWLPKVMAAVRPAPSQAPAPASLGLNTFDRDGQLQINWERNTAPVTRAVEAILEISDGSPLPQAITLDPAHLQNGFFTYARQSERVDVKLILNQPDGKQVREVTTFLGKLPVAKPAVEDPEVRKQRDQLAAEAAQLKQDLDSQAARTRKLEKDLKSVQDELKSQQQRRMANQIPAGKQ